MQWCKFIFFLLAYALSGILANLATIKWIFLKIFFLKHFCCCRNQRLRRWAEWPWLERQTLEKKYFMFNTQNEYQATRGKLIIYCTLSINGIFMLFLGMWKLLHQTIIVAIDCKYAIFLWILSQRLIPQNT